MGTTFTFALVLEECEADADEDKDIEGNDENMYDVDDDAEAVPINEPSIYREIESLHPPIPKNDYDL